MKFIIVGFKVSEEHSIHYAKVETPVEMSHQVMKAFEKGADFVSVRIIK